MGFWLLASAGGVASWGTPLLLGLRAELRRTVCPECPRGVAVVKGAKTPLPCPNNVAFSLLETAMPSGGVWAGWVVS